LFGLEQQTVESPSSPPISKYTVLQAYKKSAATHNTEESKNYIFSSFWYWISTKC